MRASVVLGMLGAIFLWHAWTDRAAIATDEYEPGVAPPSHKAALRGCGPECDFCWIGTPYEDNCPLQWQRNGDCDCGCQFPDTDDCIGGGAPDLVVQASSRDPATGVVPGTTVDLSDTVANIGTTPTGAALRMMWYISEDANVTRLDQAWGFRDVACCLEPGATSSIAGALLWPNTLPYNTPGRTYYVAVVADDASVITESNETNNWGEVWPVTLACRAYLTAAAPNHDESLWRSQDNIVRLTFDEDMPTPGQGDIRIRELLEGGSFGPDLSASFDFAVEYNDPGRPRILRIQELGSVLSHRGWYSFSSSGWVSACAFDVHYVVQVGDADNDGRVLSIDVSAINSGIPNFGAEDDDRRDINGDGRIVRVDVSVIDSSIPSFPVQKPSGH